MPPIESVLQVLSFFAYAAQAMTAALAAGRRRMDWFGVAVLGSITALGGGSVRDVLLGHYPLVWVANPEVLALTALAALAVIPLVRVVHHLKMTFLVLDAIGLDDSQGTFQTQNRPPGSLTLLLQQPLHGIANFGRALDNI